MTENYIWSFHITLSLKNWVIKAYNKKGKVNTKCTVFNSTN